LSFLRKQAKQEHRDQVADSALASTWQDGSPKRIEALLR
jgi:hypothetical protein